MTLRWLRPDLYPLALGIPDGPPEGGTNPPAPPATPSNPPAARPDFNGVPQAPLTMPADRFDQLARFMTRHGGIQRAIEALWGEQLQRRRRIRDLEQQIAALQDAGQPEAMPAGDAEALAAYRQLGTVEALTALASERDAARSALAARETRDSFRDALVVAGFDPDATIEAIPTLPAGTSVVVEEAAGQGEDTEVRRRGFVVEPDPDKDGQTRRVAVEDFVKRERPRLAEALRAQQAAAGQRSRLGGPRVPPTPPAGGGTRQQNGHTSDTAAVTSGITSRYRTPGKQREN